MGLTDADPLEDGQLASDERRHAFARVAAVSVALGHLSLMFPVLALWNQGHIDSDIASRYYLGTDVASVWIVGLVLDFLVLACLLGERMLGRGWLPRVGIALLIQATLPWIELVLASGTSFEALGGPLPLPWATTHFGPVGSLVALAGAVLAFRAMGDGGRSKTMGRTT